MTRGAAAARIDAQATWDETVRTPEACFRLNPGDQRDPEPLSCDDLPVQNRIESPTRVPYVARESNIGSAQVTNGERGSDRSNDSLNALNERLLIRLQESGIAAPSHTVINGRFVLRVANTNHRTRAEDFDVLVNEVVRLGHELRSSERGVVCTTP